MEQAKTSTLSRPSATFSPVSGIGALASTHPDSDGLQVPPVAQTQQKEADRDSEGLQRSYPTDVIAHNEKEKRESELAPLRRHRTKWWLIGAIAAIIVILIAVLGGVLGSRSHNNQRAGNGSTAPQSTATPAGGTTSQAAVPERIRSKSGTWNGTGISLTVTESQNHDLNIRACACYFQDYRGAVQKLLFSFNVTSGILFSPHSPEVVPVGIPAANGTGLASHWWDKPSGQAIQVLFVAANGTLADVFEGLDGRFISGNLSSFHFQAPTDNRPTMSLAVSKTDDHASLFAGGPNSPGPGTALQKYDYLFSSGTWSPTSTFNFTNTTGYGGVVVVDQADGPKTPGYAWSIYLTTSNGSLQIYEEQDVDASNPKSNVPSGGQKTFIGTSSQTTMANTSVGIGLPGGFGVDQLYAEDLIFANPNGSLGLQVVFQQTPITRNDSFGAYSSAVQQHRVMQGSDMQSIWVDSRSIVFYQEEGTSLAWITFDQYGSSEVASGYLFGNNTKPDGTQTWNLCEKSFCP